MSKKKRTAHRLVNFIIAISIGVCIFLGASSITYALVNQDKPDVVVQIDKNGRITQSGDMYADALWYPGFSKSGVIRLENNFKRIKVTDLSLDVNLADVSDNTVYTSFINNMILTISKGKLLAFDDILVRDKSFSELISDTGDTSDAHQFYIDKGDTVDLKYDLYMDMDSGNELMNLTADIAFRVNLNDVYNPPDDEDDKNDDKNDDNDRNNNNKNNNIIEEPVDIIPGSDGHWAHDCIIALIEHDVLDPDSESKIRPDEYITRAEAAVLMGRALKLEESKEESTGYVDNVPTWAKGYIIATTEAKVFKGYPGNVFKAYGNISREEMTAVLIRAFREASTSDSPMAFSDKDNIAKWARGNVAKSAEDGIVTGYTDNTFRPKAYMTRAEAFTIVCKLLGYHEHHNKKL